MDIAKRSFDVAVYAKAAKPQRFQSCGEGFAAFAAAFADILPESFVVLEATGGYETALPLYLFEAGVKVHRAHPLRSAHYTRSLRVNGKTDALDAQALARYAAERHDTLSVFTPADEVLQELQHMHMRLCDLKAMRMAEKQRMEHPRYEKLKESLKAVCDVLDEQIQQIEENMAAFIEQAHSLKRKYAVLTGFAGIGETTAMTLIACMPELGALTRREAASLAGVAPHPNDSGAYTGYRSTRGGRKPVRNALFMATLSAKIL
ncbi:MAG: IS110 family transposase [Alphaproteobacteria bacterium]|nr:IS110 family transposase [Alphaproteobacteria bacterium]